MIPHEPSARLRMLYREHVAAVRDDERPAMSLESQLHTVRHARKWGLGWRLLADTFGVAPAYVAALEEELGVELDP